jgi:hypothetical protein
MNHNRRPPPVIPSGERALAEKIRATWPKEGPTFEGLAIISGGPR